MEFSDLVCQLARRPESQSAVILDIDGNSDKVMMKLRQSLDSNKNPSSGNNALEALHESGFDNVHEVSKFLAENDALRSSKPREQYRFTAVMVPVVDLLDVIRECDKLNIDVVQIFDMLDN